VLGLFTSNVALSEKYTGMSDSFDAIDRAFFEQHLAWSTAQAQFLHDHRIEVVRVDRTDRQLRHRNGKSDHTDAVVSTTRTLTTNSHRHHPQAGVDREDSLGARPTSPEWGRTSRSSTVRSSVGVAGRASPSGVLQSRRRWCRVPAG
jgi:hypothetical protein